ncbi:uncharacterized protein LOC124919708 [Impatiens glandulifera]|uniref:uncharacterized protein LOC124919708 n=1 Tax=Impatiens glandulifera TaxID=253017 RepID=UPI001FB0D1AE|nr:uncharacterized protein LOC124919708 [Impatiens glandulifera]
MASHGEVGFIGLDELSLDMAASLIRSGYAVKAFEINIPLMDSFIKQGGTRCASPGEVTQGISALIVLISDMDQITKLLLGHENALKELQKDTVIILQSAISLQKLEIFLAGLSKRDIIVDIYVYKEISDTSEDELRIISWGHSDSISKARPILFAISEKLYISGGDIGSGSKMKMVIQLLEGIHLVASIEALCLGAKAGIHPWILYDIIANAAGNSWVFKNIVPKLLRDNKSKHIFLSSLVQNLGIVLDTAKSLPFPLPLLAIAHQQLIAGSISSHGIDNDLTVMKVWEKVYEVDVTDVASTSLYYPEQLAVQITKEAVPIKKIGFIGLGAMGFGMSTQLVKSNFCVLGYDVYKPTVTRFTNEGGIAGDSPADVSKDVDVLALMVANETQAEAVLYGEHGAVAALPNGASVVLFSTVSPAFVSQLEHRLQSEHRDLKLVDAPVSGGVIRASNGTLTIMASGTDEALRHAGLVLSALSEKLYIIKGGCGAGSGVKMGNQLLAGVHIASAAEAMAFGARLGLNTRTLFDAINNSRGTSWMFENRVPHMLDNDYTPLSAIDIFVKDLGIVYKECSVRKVPLRVATVAHQLFLSGSAAGWGRIDDAGVVKVYETLTGVKVEGKLPVLMKEVVIQSLPPEWPEDLIGDIQKMNQKSSKTLIVLDDDPTGTQTVHDIEVLTEWSTESLVEQFKKKPNCFFILTNSRALSSEKATALIEGICQNIRVAAESVKNVDYTVVLRGDSTLRGHFPEEADAVVSVLGEMDAWIICPFFLQGGRYTIGDTHYVEYSGGLVPAGETEFAKDASFGYKSSNLREWVEEKTRGRVQASNVASISIELLRKGGPNAVSEHLCSLQKGSICIVNAASERDVAVFSAGMIQAEQKGRRFLCRTAASFVSSCIGIIPKAPILPKDLGIDKYCNGGLIVVGSYVPKTTQQVAELKSECGHILRSIEVSVDKLAMKSSEEREEEIRKTAEIADIFLGACKDTLIMTSRELITGKTPSESLEINFKVSSALVEIVRRITVRPRYILAKGGITSSDIATKALEAKHAKVVGQALAGVPLWQLGPESRHPGVPYIVFPGNVGDNKALADVVKSWARKLSRASTKELLLNAENGGYAVGAFNVYNLEGVEAVVAAAEAEKSPAILQIHPGAFKQGGAPLVACCISAAEQASVPISVHFDHGSCKQELVKVLDLGFDSVMVDGSHLPLIENVSYTKLISNLAHSKGMLVEAELGRLSGTEDDLTVEDYEAKLTDPSQAQDFINQTSIDALAVCIGNVHGKYPASGPQLRLDLLKELYALCSEKGVYLVLHGASGLSEELVKKCIELGVRKFNVNTEVRTAYMESLNSHPKKDLVHVMETAVEAMKVVITEKFRLFGSSGKA